MPVFASTKRRGVFLALATAAVVAAGAERGNLWAAGSLSTFCANSDRSLLPQGDTLVANYRDQARLLHAAGADLFALEMLFDVDVGLAGSTKIQTATSSASSATTFQISILEFSTRPLIPCPRAT